MHRFFCTAPFLTPFGVTARCRKCENCIEMRKRLWAARASTEHALAPRTWWGTLTYADTHEGEPDYSSVQGFLKAIRKVDPHLRYLVTEERGTAKGRLHWHLLIHCSTAVKKRALEAAWPLGFSQWRLATSTGLARYMAKYAGKKAAGMRACPGYGRFRVNLDGPVTDGTYPAVAGVFKVLRKHAPPRNPPAVRTLTPDEKAAFDARWREMETSTPVADIMVNEVYSALMEEPYIGGKVSHQKKQIASEFIKINHVTNAVTSQDYRKIDFSHTGEK